MAVQIDRQIIYLRSLPFLKWAFKVSLVEYKVQSTFVITPFVHHHSPQNRIYGLYSLLDKLVSYIAKTLYNAKSVMSQLWRYNEDRLLY
jgi:hypothetical protein